MVDENKQYKFVIVSTRIRSGGAVVLHNMYQTLVDLGYDTRIFYANMYDYNHKLWFWFKMLLSAIKNIVFKAYFKITGQYDYNNMFCWGYHEHDNEPVRRKYLPFVDKETIVIYPEIYYGNMLHAKRAVRWLLSFTNHDNNIKSFGENDLIFTYREIFNDNILNPDCRKCYVSYFDLDFYKQTNYGDRNGNCYLIYKGRNRKDLPSEFDGIVVDDLSEQEKVRVFNECKYLICYDTQSAFVTLAALCGCIPIVVPEKGKGRTNYKGKDDNAYGVAFGFGEKEIEYAINTRNQLIEYCKSKNEESKNEVKKLAEECINYFN